MEAAIDRALDEIGPAGFQRLAEAYVELYWPERYRHLVPQGRNAFNATTTGWPDAWARDDDGLLHVVEATLDDDWTGHLDSDISNARDLGSVGSFVFVCRAREPRQSTLEPRNTALRNLGLRGEDVDLIFRQRLVRALAEAQFARVRAGILGLPASPHPFVAVEAARDLYADGSSVAFAPTREEYNKPNGVWRNQALPFVRARLDAEGWASIEGHGAAGKTVLCTQLALEWAAALKPAYYLDFTRLSDDDPGRVIDAMVHHGGSGVLFVVDNTHVAELSAGEVFDSWRLRQDGSRLLLSGRRVSADPWSGTGDRLKDIRSDGIAVRPTAEDIYGTYSRLARRLTPEPPAPPRFLTRRWTALFGGDLVALGAALTGKQEPTRLFPDLSPGDAVDYVNARYLAPFRNDDAGVGALVTVAALGVLEIPAPRTVVDAGLLETPLAGGAMLRAGGTVFVAHAGLARLLLAAANRDEIDVETLARCARDDPALGRLISRRLADGAEPAAKRAFWRAIVRAGDWTALLPESLDDFTEIVHAVRDASDLSWESLDDVIVAGIDWPKAARRTTLRRLVAVIGLCGARLPACSAALGRALFSEGRCAPWLSEGLAGADVKVRANLTRMIERFHPGVALQVSAAPSAEASVERVVAQINAHGFRRDVRRRLQSMVTEPGQERDELDRRLGSLPVDRWTELIARSSPRAIHRLRRNELPLARQRIDEALDRPELAAAWIAEALDGGPDQFAIAMFELRGALPTLHRRVGQELALTGDAEAWAARALSRSEAAVGTQKQVGRTFGRAVALSDACDPAAYEFISRADAAVTAERRVDLLTKAIRVQAAEALGRVVQEAPKHWPRLNQCLIALAEERDVTADLARELCNAPLSELRLVLVDHPLSRAVIASTRVDFWMVGRPVFEAATSYLHFPAIAARLSRFGRRDLAEPLAPPLAKAIVQGQVPATRVGLAHASHLLRLLPTSHQALRDALSHTLGEPTWLRGAIASLSVTELSQALYSLWCYGPELVARLTGEPLEERVTEELERGTRDGVIRLIGTVALFRTYCVDPPAWVQPSYAGELLDRQAWKRDDLAPGLAQALLGLRTVAAAGGAVRLPASRLDELIRQCDQTEAVTLRQREILAGLRRWLEEMRMHDGAGTT